MDKTYLVIGLGTFGFQAAKALCQGGATVLAIDRNDQAIDTISNLVTRAVCTDATNDEALDAVGAFQSDVAIIALRRHFDTTVLVTHNLMQRGVKEILVQVDSEKEGQAVRAVGATSVIFAERDMAERIAQKLLIPDLVDQIPLGDGVGIVEVACPASLAGKTLAQSSIRREYGVTVIAVRSAAEVPSTAERVDVAPAADLELTQGDVLVVIGKSQQLAEFKRDLTDSAREDQEEREEQAEENEEGKTQGAGS